jgi:thiamine-monophosphate kinase
MTRPDEPPALPHEFALPREFALIARHFRPLAGEGSLGLTDDAALLAPPPGARLVLSTDMMSADVHFLPDDPPELVARKLLRVNLSDLAAMGAEPLGYLLGLALPRGTEERWFAAFSAGLAEDQRAFGLSILGGDTTAHDGPLTLSLTIVGSAAENALLLRRGARPGDEVWVSGTLGDAALGLAARRGELADPTGHLTRRYLLPEPRLGLVPPGLAHAGMDVSDGLVQDLGHICRASGVGAEIEAAALPLSAAARAHGARAIAAALAGGDDYELLLALPPGAGEALRAAGEAHGVPFTRIGRFLAGPPEVRVRGPDGAPLTLERGGFSHF